MILALSSLPPQALGWDESMRMRLQSASSPKLQFCRSTDPCVKIKDYGQSADKVQWAIRVPVTSGDSAGRWFVTVRALSLRAAVMMGRATLVWLVQELDADWQPLEVCPVCDSHVTSFIIHTLPCSQLHSDRYLVLKASWIPLTKPSEKEVFGDLPEPHGQTGQQSEQDPKSWIHYVGQVECSVPVGSPTLPIIDNAPESARRNFMKSARRAIWGPEGPALSMPRSLEGEEERGWFRPRAYGQELAEELNEAYRVHTRTLLRTYGRSIKSFLSLTQLVTALRDAIRGNDCRF